MFKVKALLQVVAVTAGLACFAPASRAVVDPVLGEYTPGMNFDLAGAFNLVVFGDHTQSNVDVEGRLAVGGNATLSNFSVGSSAALPSSTTRGDIFVGGAVDIQNGSNYKGNTYRLTGSSVVSYTMTNNNGVPGQPIVNDDFDFADLELYLQGSSMCWSELASNGSVVMLPWGELQLNGTDPALNIFDIDGTNLGSGFTLSSINTLRINAPIGSTILVNIAGANVGFGNYSIFRNLLPTDPATPATGGDGQYILWNFFEATTLTTQNLSVKGSILAPYATWLAQGFGNYEGTAMVNSLINDGGNMEGHDYIFLGSLPDCGGTVSNESGDPDDDLSSLPKVMKVSNPSPNPFNPSTRLAFALGKPGAVRVTVHDLQGRLVRTLASGNYAVGDHQLTWLGMNDAGRPVTSGTYLMRVQTAETSQTVKAVLVR